MLNILYNDNDDGVFHWNGTYFLDATGLCCLPCWTLDGDYKKSYRLHAPTITYRTSLWLRQVGQKCSQVRYKPEGQSEFSYQYLCSNAGLNFPEAEINSGC